MAAAGQNARHSPSVSRALQWKRRSIDQEIEEFRAKKELEFKDFEERLSTGRDDPDRLSLEADCSTSRGHADAGAHQTASEGKQQQQPQQNLDATRATASVDANDATTNVFSAPSPTVSRHDKERELQGLFLPHFIPLLDNASKLRGPSSRTTSASDPITPLLPSEFPTARLSTGPSGAVSPDPSAASPRTSPSPSLIAVPSPPLTETGGRAPDYSLTETTPEQISSTSSPPEELPSDLPLLTRSPRRTPEPPASPPRELLSPKPIRPELGTRNSSTQSDASSHSLRSSLRKTKAGPGHGRKKSVRISVDDQVLAPGGASPVQTRDGWRLPERVNRPADESTGSSTSGSDSDQAAAPRLYPSSRSVPNRVSLVEDIADITSPILRSSVYTSDNTTNGFESPKRPILKRDRRPSSLDQVPSRNGNPSGQPGDVLSGTNFIPAYYPPQPLRSPSSMSTSRPSGRDLIEPIRTPPAGASSEPDHDDFFASDPLFGDGDSANSSRPSSGEGQRRGNGDTRGRRFGNEFDEEEDMFQDYEDGREESDVVNGHDDFDAYDLKSSGISKGRRISKDDNTGFDSLNLHETGTSPHAGSLPIEIRSSRGWGGRPWQ